VVRCLARRTTGRSDRLAATEVATCPTGRCAQRPRRWL